MCLIGLIATLFLVSSMIAMCSPLANVKGDGAFSKSQISNMTSPDLALVLWHSPQQYYLVLTQSENTSRQH
jgi:hypothetical protein